MTEKSLEGALIAFCNPLLDITATVDQDFLSKYNYVFGNFGNNF